MKTAKRFFSLEGIDGSGKSTQIDMLIKELESEGYEVVKLREPGGAKISEQIRGILLDPAFKGIMGDDTELLLYNAARAQVIAEIIRPALAAGKVVIADRFAWSTFAYQGYARGLGADKVQRLTELTCGDCFPELTVVLDITVERSRARTAKRGEAPDRLESEKAEFFEKVRQGYLAAARDYSDCVQAIDGDRAPEDVFADLVKLVKAKLV
ncbi:dTMP kinase [Fibrobacter sp. UWEL]|uniref:dTMP kinase n=1 Tax=Fibrobacter sp. UWEL TaxID=1896209 RepID=UPI000917B3C0|nr:dTMP kinase [Fibrobacter sp. UWEL]SHL15562.1 thymidylate kinase [Fibrobacter sp. UWEL]